MLKLFEQLIIICFVLRATAQSCL